MSKVTIVSRGGGLYRICCGDDCGDFQLGAASDDIRSGPSSRGGRQRAEPETPPSNVPLNPAEPEPPLGPDVVPNFWLRHVVQHPDMIPEARLPLADVLERLSNSPWTPRRVTIEIFVRERATLRMHSLRGLGNLRIYTDQEVEVDVVVSLP